MWVSPQRPGAGAKLDPSSIRGSPDVRFHTVRSDLSAPPPPLTRRSARWLWPVLAPATIGALGLAGYLLDELTDGDTFRLDRVILLALRRPNDLATPVGPAWLEQSAIDLSALGGFTLLWILGGAGLILLASTRRRAEAAWLGASLLGSSALSTALKVYIDRPRPELVPHLAVVSDPSFPSGHAMISAAVYLTLGAMLAENEVRTVVRTLLMAFAAVLVVLIGCSRVYLGVHWPSDVLAGWCFGGVWAFVVFASNRWLRRRHAGRTTRPLTTAH